jgi:hypothetical protein
VSRTEGDSDNKLIAKVPVDYLETVGKVEWLKAQKFPNWDSLGLDGL